VSGMIGIARMALASLDEHCFEYQAGRMKLISALVFFTIATSANQASAQQIMIAGIGSKPCSYWTSTPATKSEGEKWALGFWSALNYVAAITKSRNQLIIDPDTMLLEIEKTCAEGTGRSLADATWITFITLTKSPQ
jgi:hypothetical protein